MLQVCVKNTLGIAEMHQGESRNASTGIQDIKSWIRVVIQIECATDIYAINRVGILHRRTWHSSTRRPLRVIASIVESERTIRYNVHFSHKLEYAFRSLSNCLNILPAIFLTLSGLIRASPACPRLTLSSPLLVFFIALLVVMKSFSFR